MAAFDRASAQLEKTELGSVRSEALVKELRALSSVVAVHGRQLRIVNSARHDPKAGVLNEPGSPALVDPLIGVRPRQ
jgi:hypothetical protein